MDTKRINLALQGGGAHGAFTWGVLDRLLDEDWIEIAAISGTSAGALNGAALKSGLAQASGTKGREAAREALNWLWSQVAEGNDFRTDRWVSALFPYPDTVTRWFDLFTPAFYIENWLRLLSPYDSGPFYINPLARVVQDLEFENVCAKEGPAFFVSATNVRNGKIRIFSGDEVTPDALLASACLPNLFRAVEIDDPVTGRREAYWDGGYTGNPALFPLFEPQFPRDIMIVNINPLAREGIPTTPQQIEERITEISFNTSLLRELRAINFARRVIAEKHLPERAMKDVLIHLIADDDTMLSLSQSSKVSPSYGTLGRLKTAGQQAADRFLDQHADKIGKEPSVNLAELFG
ncbi:patatin-like phospholipase family protein [Thioclava sp. GXIMD4216]|uniref:Patatin-like phospholipase family protein n=1 Tax=Thioclava litoralis TaxID=3076557 RepID=A0ABZ1E1E7_9RHOB|nr:patatin-like phospholipase family protein [Thioclava sp. FTW29]